MLRTNYVRTRSSMYAKMTNGLGLGESRPFTTHDSVLGVTWTLGHETIRPRRSETRTRRSRRSQDLFKEMFGSEDPFADFHKFFDDARTQGRVSWEPEVLDQIPS